MCGIAGYYRPTSGHPDELKAVVTAMARALSHRGPDDEGIWVDATAGIALGHRRLSVIDLSPEGHQPMSSSSGRYLISFNGEIYNFQEIRAELESLGHRFRGHSDTEVAVAAIEQWGLKRALKRFVGMFAFALWDRRENILYLTRDRMGEKPLYYGRCGDAFVFASELKALHDVPGWTGTIDRNALTLFLRHGYVPRPYSIYADIRKLTPGTLLAVDRNFTAGQLPSPEPYWSVEMVAAQGREAATTMNAFAAAEELDRLLRKAIVEKMVADVPLGAFLSGGIDSSTVVALMQAQSPRPVRTFTIGFHESSYNEAEAAKAVARHLGTDHTEMYVSPMEAMAVIPRLPQLYDEPFADPSQIPTFLVSELARRHVTVILSGDGGDELFGGYTRYFLGRQIWRKIGWMPLWLRRLGARVAVGVSPRTWKAIVRSAPVLFGGARVPNPDHKVHRLAAILKVRDPVQIYRLLLSHWEEPAAMVLGATEPPTPLSEPYLSGNLVDFTEQMLYLDMIGYLPDDILVKVDRASMGVSLEARVPLLDHRLVEFAWKLPLSQKIRGGEGKWLLRQVLDKYVPRELIDRPKMGFGVPIDSWLRGPLRDWAEAYLAPDRLGREGFLSSQSIQDKWAEHLSGRRDWQYYLWDVLMFETWLEEQKKAPARNRAAALA
jgi:asparagine synthase (glutamine-hydrolysing)